MHTGGAILRARGAVLAIWRSALASVLCGFLLSLGALGCATPERPDPWQKLNRGTFWVNEKLDIAVMKPVAQGWRYVTPGFVRTGFSNFFTNMRVPIVFLNDLLQGKPAAAGFDILRLIYNTSFGLGGLIDIATMVEIPKNDEDFGQTLGVWGVSPGPYFVIPILGPSSVRHAAGRIVDAGSLPQSYFIPFWGSLIINTTELINVRTKFIDEIDASREEAFDYYVFVRNVYIQNREARVRDHQETSDEASEDLYYIEGEEDLDEDEDYDDL